MTIPHKQAALEGAAEVDPVAAQIGAVNTLVRQPDGTSLKGYNTDWSAAIAAIEGGLDAGAPSSTDASSSPLAGKTVVVVGAGGAGRALAFGAAVKGAHVVIANRSVQKAADLAAQLSPPATACSLEDLASGAVRGDVLANSTSVGMHPEVGGLRVRLYRLRGLQPGPPMHRLAVCRRTSAHAALPLRPAATGGRDAGASGRAGWLPAGV